MHFWGPPRSCIGIHYALNQDTTACSACFYLALNFPSTKIIQLLLYPWRKQLHHIGPVSFTAAASGSPTIQVLMSNESSCHLRYSPRDKIHSFLYTVYVISLMLKIDPDKVELDQPPWRDDTKCLVYDHIIIVGENYSSSTNNSPPASQI